MVDDPQKMLSELARLGARLIIQRAVEEEFDSWLGRARPAARSLLHLPANRQVELRHSQG
jgi:hypothetical protein